MGADEQKNSSAPVVPRILHHIWLGGQALPTPFAQFIRSWRDLHPAWEFHTWDEENMPGIRNRGLFDRAYSIAGDARSAHQLQADILRYEILYRFGGVYVDVDVQPLKAIDSLLNVDAFAGWEDTDVWINNAVLGGVSQHPFFDALVDRLYRSVEHRPAGARPNVYSGPQYMTGVYGEFKGDVTVYPKDYFYPYLWDELHRGGEDFPGSFAVHHWNNMRARHAAAIS